MPFVQNHFFFDIVKHKLIVKYTYHGSTLHRKWCRSKDMTSNEMVMNKLGHLTVIIEYMSIWERCSFFCFDIKFSTLFSLWCTLRRKILWNVFDVMYIESSMYCIFRDRSMRPKNWQIEFIFWGLSTIQKVAKSSLPSDKTIKALKKLHNSIFSFH